MNTQGGPGQRLWRKCLTDPQFLPSKHDRVRWSPRHLGFVLLPITHGGPLGDGCLWTCGACGAWSAYQLPTKLGWLPRTPLLVLPRLRCRTFWFRYRIISAPSKNAHVPNP